MKRLEKGQFASKQLKEQVEHRKKNVKAITNGPTFKHVINQYVNALNLFNKRHSPIDIFNFVLFSSRYKLGDKNF